MYNQTLIIAIIIAFVVLVVAALSVSIFFDIRRKFQFRKERRAETVEEREQRELEEKREKEEAQRKRDSEFSKTLLNFVALLAGLIVVGNILLWLGTPPNNSFQSAVRLVCGMLGFVVLSVVASAHAIVNAIRERK